MSILDPLTCGFVKVFCYNLFTQAKNISHTPGNPKHNQTVMLKENYDSFLKTFSRETHGIVECRTLKIITNMRSLGTKCQQKTRHLLEVFSTSNWHN